ncbi:MAG: hypothetical protein PHO56_05465 [Patescibacteria group bacterium]|nr:hypothetical protein [Patescibacteria group bacterium]
MSFENWKPEEPEEIPMNEVHKEPAKRAIDNLPDEENFDVDAEKREGEVELSPEDQDVYDYVVKGLEGGKKENFSDVKIDNPGGFLTKLGKKFGGSRSLLTAALLTIAGGMAGSKAFSQDAFDELHSRVAAEKVEESSGNSEQRLKQVQDEMTKDMERQAKKMGEITGQKIDLSGKAENKIENKQEKESKIDFEKFFKGQFPAAKEIKVIKQGNDCVANVDGKIYVGSASAGADDNLARERAEISADGARAQFLAGNFGKTESFSHVIISGGGAPMERRAEGKDGYTYFVFYQMSE